MNSTSPPIGTRTGETGSATLEVAALAPVMLLLICVIILAGQIQTADQAVDAAAHDAARYASLARDAYTSRTEARAAAVGALDRQGLGCRHLHVDVDTSGFRVPVGRSAVVRAAVTCVLPLSHLGIPWIPGSRTIRSDFTSHLDRYRER